MTATITRERKAEIAAQIRTYNERHAQHVAAADGHYPFCGCNPYQDIISNLPEYDPEDPRNLAIPEQHNEYVLGDGTVIEETGTGAWVIDGDEI